MRHEPAPGTGLDVLDVRLAPALLGAWLVSLAVVRVPVAVAVAGALACAVLAGTCGWWWRQGSGADGGRRWSGALALTLAVAATTAGAGAAQVASRDSGGWRGMVGDAAQLTGTVSGDPVMLAPAWPGAPPQAMWQLTVDQIDPVDAQTAGRHARAPVRVLGPAAAIPSLGTRVSVAGSLQAVPRGDRAVAVLLTKHDARIVSPAPLWWRAGAGIRTAETQLAKGMTGDARALLPGVTVGDTTQVPADLTVALRAAGLTHLTAVSGAHFSLVAMLALLAAGVARVPRRARAPVVVVAMGAMVLVVHPSPSVLRAAVMGLVGVWALLLGRPARAPAALAAAVVVLLVVDPWLAGELGFVLSVLATAGIVVIAEPLTERWSRRVGRPFAAALAVPVAAQLLCAPVIVLLNPSLSTYAVPANLLAAPAVAPATVLGLAAGVTEWCGPVAHALAWGAGAGCWWIGAVARFAAGLPGAQLTWLPGAAGVTLLAVVGACVVRLLLPRRT